MPRLTVQEKQEIIRNQEADALCSANFGLALRC